MKSHLSKLLREHRRSARGVTLTEVLLVVAIAAFIIVGAVMLYTTVFSDTKTNDAQRQVQAIISNIRSLYTGAPNFGEDDFTDVAVKAQVFNNTEVVNGVPLNPWGGEIALEGVGTSFTITYPDVPRKPCVKLIRMNNTGLGGAALSVAVNDTIADDLNITAADAVDLCSQDDRNTIVWQVR